MDASFNPKSDWQTFDEVLSEKGIPRQVMIYPERYMDQYNVTRRRGAIKEMFRRGLVVSQLTGLTNFSRQYLYSIRDEVKDCVYTPAP